MDPELSTYTESFESTATRIVEKMKSSGCGFGEIRLSGPKGLTVSAPPQYPLYSSAVPFADVEAPKSVRVLVVVRESGDAVRAWLFVEYGQTRNIVPMMYRFSSYLKPLQTDGRNRAAANPAPLKPF